MKTLRFTPLFLTLLVLTGLVLTASAAGAPAPAKPGSERYELPKVEVKGSIVCSFGIGVAAMWDRDTQTISRLFIENVAPDSDAATLGLVRGDEILSINGKKITDMKGGTKRGGDLFELLVNQPIGRKIDIEVAVRAVKRVSLQAGFY